MPRSAGHRQFLGVLVIVLALGWTSSAVSAQPSPAVSAQPSPPPSGSTSDLAALLSADIPLTTEQLIALRARMAATTAAPGEPRIVVAATSIARNVLLRAPFCPPRSAGRRCLFGVLESSPGASSIIPVWTRPSVAVRFGGGDKPVEGVLAFGLDGARLVLLGRVAAATPGETHPLSVDEPSMERADRLPEGRLLAVEGWLGVLGWGVPCPAPPGKLGRQGTASPFVRCPGGWIGADEASLRAGRYDTAPPRFAIPVQAAAYALFAPEPGSVEEGATPPRRAVYLLRRVANPEPEFGDAMGWRVIGRLDPVPEEDLAPISPPAAAGVRVGPRSGQEAILRYRPHRRLWGVGYVAWKPVATTHLPAVAASPHPSGRAGRSDPAGT